MVIDPTPTPSIAIAHAAATLPHACASNPPRSPSTGSPYAGVADFPLGDSGIAAGVAPVVRVRQVLSAQRWADVLALYPASGLTQAAFARRENVNYHTLVARLGRSRLDAQSASRGGAVCRPASSNPSTAQLFIEASAPGLGASAPLEVVLPTGLIVRGVEPGAMAALVYALGAVAGRANN